MHVSAAGSSVPQVAVQSQLMPLLSTLVLTPLDNVRCGYGGSSGVVCVILVGGLGSVRFETPCHEHFGSRYCIRSRVLSFLPLLRFAKHQYLLNTIWCNAVLLLHPGAYAAYVQPLGRALSA